MVAVNSTRDLSITVGNFSDVFNYTVSPAPHFSSPVRDEVGGVTLSITWPCLYSSSGGGGSGGGGKQRQELIGVVGLDIHLGALMEEVTYFSEQDGAYAFVVDRKGEWGGKSGEGNGC